MRRPADPILAELYEARRELYAAGRDTHLPGVLNLAPDRKGQRVSIFEQLDAIGREIVERRRELKEEATWDA